MPENEAYDNPGDPTPRHLDFPGYDDPDTLQRLRDLAAEPPTPERSAEPPGGLLPLTCPHCGRSVR
jgi:hypothetical protein